VELLRDLIAFGLRLRLIRPFPEQSRQELVVRRRAFAVGDNLRLARRGGVGRARRRRVIRLGDDRVVDELIAVARHRADESGSARVIAQRAPQRPDCLAERTVRHDHVGPDTVENRAPIDGAFAGFDEQQ
jgi:hypothetical protein